MHWSHYSEVVWQSASMEYFVMDHIVRCLMMIWDTFLGLEHWTRQVSWLVDLHLELLGVELLLRCGRDLWLTLDRLVVLLRSVYGMDITDCGPDLAHYSGAQLEGTCCGAAMR